MSHISQKFDKKNINLPLRWWSGSAMELGKLLVPERPNNLDNSRARATALAVGAEGVVCVADWLLWGFLLYIHCRPRDIKGSE